MTNNNITFKVDKIFIDIFDISRDKIFIDIFDISPVYSEFVFKQIAICGGSKKNIVFSLL